MLKKLQAWLSANRQADTAFGDQPVLLEWAKQQGASCRRVKRPQAGWVLEWPDGQSRLEWGDSRRPYISGHELRWFFSCELGEIDASTEMVVLSQSFAKRIEAELFGKLTADNHTTLESGLPDEVRWIAMWPAHLLPETRNTHALLCHSRDNAWRDVWASPELVAALQHAANNWWQAESAVTLSFHRKALVLRLASNRLEIAHLDQIKHFLELLRQTISVYRF